MFLKKIKEREIIQIINQLYGDVIFSINKEQKELKIFTNKKNECFLNIKKFKKLGVKNILLCSFEDLNGNNEFMVYYKDKKFLHKIPIYFGNHINNVADMWETDYWMLFKFTNNKIGIYNWATKSITYIKE